MILNFKNLIKNFLIDYKIIIFFSLAILIARWLSSFNNINENLFSYVLFSFQDHEYFTFIFNLADLNFRPNYLDYRTDNGILPIPIYSLFLHSLFYKIFGLYSFFILEFIFVFLFIFLLVKIFQKCNLSFDESFLLTLLLIFLANLSSYFRLSYINFDNFFGFRFPRPLVSSVFFLLGFYCLLFFYRKNSSKYFYIFLGLILALNFGSVFYNFIILFSIFFLIIIDNLYSKNIRISKKLIKNFFILLITFVIFSFPFILIAVASEPDYLQRIGVFVLSLDQKIYLLKYFFNKFLSTIFLASFIFISYLMFFFYKKKNKEYNINTIKVIYFFSLSSILSLIFFIMFSPSVTEVYHIVNLITVSILLNIVVFFYLFIRLLNNSYLFSFKKKIFNFFIIIIIIILNINISLDFKNKNLNLRNDLIKLDSFLQKKNLNNFNSLLTFNSYFQIWWIFNNNKKTTTVYSIFSEYNNVLLEKSYFENLKFLGISDSSFIRIISNEKQGWRYNNIYVKYFSYWKYQANSLKTFDDSLNFEEDVLQFIKSSSPLYTQQIAIPNEEKKRMFDLYKKTNSFKYINPDIIILESNSFLSKNNQIKSLDYCLLKDYKYFSIYINLKKSNCS
jgi:hypothetical protein